MRRAPRLDGQATAVPTDTAAAAREPTALNDYLLVGRISGLFGTRGWVKVFSYTRPRDNLLEYDPWFLRVDGEWRRYAVREARRHHGGVIALLEGIDDRDQAATLVKREIAVTRAQLGPSTPGEYYWADLVGLQVTNLQGEALGHVEGLLETGAHDVLRVVGEREYLVPYVRDVYVLAIDLAAGTMQVDWHADD